MKIISIYDARVAPAPEWEYYTAAEISTHKANGRTLAVVAYAHDQFLKAYCVAIDVYNDAVDDYIDALMEAGEE
jgi:hypothetical protein